MGAAELGRWARAVTMAVRGLQDPDAIRQALDRMGHALPLGPFAELSERRMLHSLMLGALDATWERENEQQIKLETFGRVTCRLEGEAVRQFAERPFSEALRLFESRQVLPRKLFDRLKAGAKRRAFTVAGLAREELLKTAHEELTRQIRESAERTFKDAEGVWRYKGPILQDFQKHVRDRLESAGWTPANPSHVETVFRTNVVSAYSSGRFAEMTQPEVLAARPYWQAMTVRDSRQRPTHRAAHGIVLPADHEFWKRAFPPWGYNCRCRAVSRSERWFKASKKSIGPVPQNLPDPGFDAGIAPFLEG